MAWDANTESDLAGYRIYYGIVSPEEHSVDIGNMTTYTLTGLTKGQKYYIAATAYDTSNNEGPKCAPISGTAK